jgi:hypothetical protein
MNKGLNNVYLILALVATSFAAGRFYANSTLMEENQKLKESVRLLRGGKTSAAQAESGSHAWQNEKRPDAVALAPMASPARKPEAQPAPPVELPLAVTKPAIAPALAAVAEQPGTEPVAHDAQAKKPAAARQEPASASTPERPEATPAPPAANGRKTGKRWVSDLGDHIQGTATYWHCNNAALVASGMDYYAYGSIPANRIKKPGDAYSVRDSLAIVISGCWSPKLGKAILYRKSDGRRWEPTFNLNDGSWTQEEE